MGAVNVTVRLDENIKMQAEEVFYELGLNMSSAVNVFVHTVARQRRIPFELSLNETDPFYSESNQKMLWQSIQHGKDGKFTEHELIEN